jgi:predicted nuclease with TOPRIM domain
MEQITLRLHQRTLAELEREADALGVSRSEHVRDVIESREDADALRAEVEELRERVDRREERVDELEEQLARRSQVEEKVDVLAQRVEERDRSADAPFFVKWWRWARGSDGDE